METPATTTELLESIERAKKGLKDPKAMRKACDRMDSTREALRQKLGHDVDVAVPAIRELRDSECG